MNLNHNSTSAKLYRWFYGTNIMPTNLCPYFWKSVAAMLFCIPVFLWTAPFMLLHRDDHSSTGIGERLGISAITWIFILAAISMLTPFALIWIEPTKGSLYFNTVCAGIMCWMVAVVVGIIELVKYIREKIEDAKWKKMKGGRHNVYDEHGNWVGYRYEKPKANIFVEFIKAKYNRYCPKIDWTE